MRPTYANRRIDTAAKPLIAAARGLGVEYENLGGAIDGMLWLGPVVRLVDWKTPGKAALTEGQGKLLARGCPIHFVSTVAQLQALVAEMHRAAHRKE